MPPAYRAPVVQIIVPARNEQACIGRCLESLTGQQGIDFQITVVDDRSSDQTRTIAQAFPGVRVISTLEPGPGVTGKCNALIRGAEGVTGKWLLFTDADTFHCPGSLAAAVSEAERRDLDLLSYSPDQETGSWGERALLPLVFADLARAYPLERVNNPADPAVAANGQYILARRQVYESLGGHREVSDKILEDVELARVFKASGHKIWFRRGDHAVRTRMYRDFHSMCEGWTKNLALLFQHPVGLAALRSLEFAAIAFSLISGLVLLLRGSYGIGACALIAGAAIYASFLMRIRRAHFLPMANLLSFFGLPLFAGLLLRSWLHLKVRGAITWKGRTYPNSAPGGAPESSIESSKAES